MSARWHIVTPELPPECGGVGDYTAQIAEALARSGDSVSVYSPPAAARWTPSESLEVVALGDRFSNRTMRELTARVDRNAHSRLLVQYVPAVFGRRGTNLAVLPLAPLSPSRRGGRPRDVSRAIPLFALAPGSHRHRVHTAGDGRDPARRGEPPVPVDRHMASISLALPSWRRAACGDAAYTLVDSLCRRITCSPGDKKRFDRRREIPGRAFWLIRQSHRPDPRTSVEGSPLDRLSSGGPLYWLGQRSFRRRLWGCASSTPQPRDGGRACFGG